MLCCIHQLAGDKPPPLVAQSSLAVSAPQLFRAHTSTWLSIPVKVEVLGVQPWREKLRCGSPTVALKQSRTVFFPSQADFLLFIHKCGYGCVQGFPPHSASCPLASHQFFPVTTLEPGREGWLLYGHKAGFCGQ